MIRTEVTSLDGVPAHLMAIVAAALAAKLEVSLWEVREHVSVHVREGAVYEWARFDPFVRWADAMLIYALVGRLMGVAILSNSSKHAICDFGMMRRATIPSVQYGGDVFAAMRAAITLAAKKVYERR